MCIFRLISCISILRLKSFCFCTLRLKRNLGYGEFLIYKYCNLLFVFFVNCSLGMNKDGLQLSYKTYTIGVNRHHYSSFLLIPELHENRIKQNNSKILLVASGYLTPMLPPNGFRIQ